jgi:hypothetical protein
VSRGYVRLVCCGHCLCVRVCEACIQAFNVLISHTPEADWWPFFFSPPLGLLVSFAFPVGG